jgi:hypothetical protein
MSKQPLSTKFSDNSSHESSRSEIVIPENLIKEVKVSGEHFFLCTGTGYVHPAIHKDHHANREV